MEANIETTRSIKRSGKYSRKKKGDTTTVKPMTVDKLMKKAIALKIDQKVRKSTDHQRVMDDFSLFIPNEEIDKFLSSKSEKAMSVSTVLSNVENESKLSHSEFHTSILEFSIGDNSSVSSIITSSEIVHHNNSNDKRTTRELVYYKLLLDLDHNALKNF